MKRPISKTLERPLNVIESVEEIDEDSVDDEGDIYEMRGCDDCERMLPLDRPGHRVKVEGELKVVCSRCYEYWEIFGDDDGEDF